MFTTRAREHSSATQANKVLMTTITMPIQLNAEDDTAGQSGGDSFKIVNNIVNHCGGHNCLQVHYDTGAPLVQGNRVGPGCVHNCIDTKGVGNGLTSPAPLVGK